MCSISTPPKILSLIHISHAASATYVRNKERACAAIGMESDTIRLPETITQEELLAQIEQLNEDPCLLYTSAQCTCVHLESVVLEPAEWFAAVCRRACCGVCGGAENGGRLCAGCAADGLSLIHI